MATVWTIIERLIRQQGAAALVTVVSTRGSAPREAGARMAVAPGGAIAGSIGGGTLEWRAIDIARTILADGDSAATLRRSFALGPDLGQCCGGRAEIAIERFGAADLDRVGQYALLEASGGFAAATRFGDSTRPTERRIATGRLTSPPEDCDLVETFGDRRHPVLLFGAGHVGRALILALAPLPFAVTWADSRADAFPELMPENVTAVLESRPAGLVADAPAEALVVIMTHSHALDLDICAAALARNTFPYVGVIGSATKRARFASQLAAAGLGQSAIDRLRCPIGVPGISGKEPPIIAAAVAAELLIMRTRHRAGTTGAQEAVDNFTL
jgi:xanthine dehydrogenase accessory factor